MKYLIFLYSLLQCSFDDDDRNTETKKHTTIKGFVDCYLKCNHRPLFSFLTHFSGRRRVHEETGEKTVGTDERIARRILEEYPELMNEVSIAFDGMIVDLNRQFPSLACELSMLFQILLFVLITFTIIIMFIQNLHSYQKQTIKNK